MQLRRELGGASRATSRRLTPGARAGLVSWIAVALALGAMGLAIFQPSNVSLLAMGCLGVGCALVISGVRLSTIGVGSVALFCLTASWDQVTVGGIEFRMLFLFLGLLLLAPTLDLRRLPPVPWWLHAYGLSAVVVTCLQAAMPISDGYLDGRYVTSTAGQLLGSRPSGFLSLLSLLFNTYAIPVIIVLACMYLPKALKLLVATYVAGAALSSLAGILGYYGQPFLLDLFGTVPIADGVRAKGFTNHSLRLATSEVMTIALAAWLALQRHRGLRTCGWISVPPLVVGLFVSGSRGGLVAGLLVLVLSMYMLPAVRSRIHVVVSGVVAALLGVSVFFPSVVSAVIGSTRIIGDATTEFSDTGRSEVLTQGLEDFYTSPIFGIGVQYIAEAHTLYVGVLAAGGIIFGVGYLLFNVGSLRTSIQALKVDRSLGGALLTTLIASLGYWTVADLIQTATVSTIYGFVIALWWQGQSDAAASPSGPATAGGREVVVHPEHRTVTSTGVRPG